METYVREHHTQLRRRLESVKRIHKASDTVEENSSSNILYWDHKVNF